MIPACFDPARTGPTTTAELLEAALFYATVRRWRVLPLSPTSKLPCIPSAHPAGDPLRGRCRGECGRDGHGCHDGSTDPERITRWWSQYPTAMVGLATGPKPGQSIGDDDLEVLDLDYDADIGLDAGAFLDGYARRHGHDWDDLTDDALQVAAGSPSGGVHLFGRACGGRTVANLLRSEPKEKTGVDWRGRGGLVVAAPSYSAKRDARYVWAADDLVRPLPTFPSWLVDIARPAVRLVREVQPAKRSPRDVGGTATPYAAAVLERSCDEIAGAADGARNATLNGCAYRVGRFVAGRELEADYAADRLVIAAERCGYDRHRAEAIVDYAFAAAADAPARTPEAGARPMRRSA